MPLHEASARGRHRAVCAVVIAIICALSHPRLRAVEQALPSPFGSVPSERQLKWQALEFYGLMHFGLNTYTDQEWGFGDVSPDLFNPTEFDADKVVAVAKDAGMRGLILVCKHHDGFCLWPSRFTDYSVAKSPWKDGKGDLVKDLSQACKGQGLKFGVYLSPWDRHHADYGRPEYLTYYRNQLRELLLGYGDIFMSWYDGANGGSGYYGGARETRRIDRSSYYDWPATWEIVRQLQPGACIFSDVGPDVRWAGNEQGQLDDPCWYGVNTDGLYPGAPITFSLARGERNGSHWIPPECDASIRPGWFYHSRQDQQVKSPRQLVDLYYSSVGHGACLDLNIPLDRRGLIPDKDAANLGRFAAILNATFSVDLAHDAKPSATNARGAAKAFAPESVLDRNPMTYWCTDDSVLTPELTLELPKPTTFNVVRVREFLPLGQRVEGFALDEWTGSGWREFAHGVSIGSQRLLRTSRITTTQIRLRITKSAACPAISEVAVFLEPSSAIMH